jgi:hypothetical protein
MKEFLIGSKAFFSDFSDFVPVDTDILIIDNNIDSEYPTKSWMDGDYHYVQWLEWPKEEFIEYHKTVYAGRYIQKFLVPEFAEYLGLTISDLQELHNLIDFLDGEHGYCKVVYDYYIQNNGFFLTQEQLEEAYRVYKLERGLL